MIFTAPKRSIRCPVNQGRREHGQHVPLNDRRGLTEAETEILHRQWRRRHDQIHDAVAEHGAGGGHQEAAPGHEDAKSSGGDARGADVRGRHADEHQNRE